MGICAAIVVSLVFSAYHLGSSGSYSKGFADGNFSGYSLGFTDGQHQTIPGTGFASGYQVGFQAGLKAQNQTEP